MSKQLVVRKSRMRLEESPGIVPACGLCSAGAKQELSNKQKRKCKVSAFNHQDIATMNVPMWPWRGGTSLMAWAMQPRVWGMLRAPLVVGWDGWTASTEPGL